MKTMRVSATSLLEALAAKSKTTVSPIEAAALLARSSHEAAVLLGQLARRGVLTRLRRGLYAIVPFGKEQEFGNPFVVAHALAQGPHFISHLGALSYHDLLLQPANVVHVSVSKQRPPLEIGSTTFAFVPIPRARFWGFENSWVTATDAVPVSDVHRTLLDACWRPDLCGGIAQVATAFWQARRKVNAKRLVAYVRKFGKKVVAKRVGFLAETLGINAADIAPSLLKYLGGTRPYSLIDPTLPPDGRFNSRWGLRLNVTAEEIVAATKS
jgi:predicted transcriptional regulator of viral defense system